MPTKYIFVVGGVMSSVGKGITVASLGKLLQSKGYRVCMIKCDMYVNVDAGTIRPTEHGEVFVGEDGIEADQDLGNYERFTGIISTRANYITTGQIYKTVIERERNLGYGGEDVEVVPDIPNEIIRRIKEASSKNNSEITIVEIGGTVGEYQNLLFLEAGRMMHLEYPEGVIFILVSYLPIPRCVGEMKTKPTQYASRSLNSAGIQADFIIGRSEEPLDQKRKEKLSIFCNLPAENIISAPDVESIYEVPLNMEKEGLGIKILKKLGLEVKEADMADWGSIIGKIKLLRKELKIAVVGKYFATGNFVLSDSYISVIEAIKHACWAWGVNPKLTWINSQKFEDDTSSVPELNQYKGIIVPGGFGERGIEGIINSIKYCRENNIPFLGLCLGLQLAVIEFARNVCGLSGANSAEMEKDTNIPIIDMLPEQKELLKQSDYGATMRLGSYPAVLKEGTKVYELYRNFKLITNGRVSERHRHRYELNPNYHEILREKGLVFSGVSPDRKLVEFIELPNHKFFVATQAHPEFKSTLLQPSPLFYGFVKSCLS